MNSIHILSASSYPCIYIHYLWLTIEYSIPSLCPECCVSNISCPHRLIDSEILKLLHVYRQRIQFIIMTISVRRPCIWYVQG